MILCINLEQLKFGRYLPTIYVLTTMTTTRQYQ